jgi:hypothetical protein
MIADLPIGVKDLEREGSFLHEGVGHSVFRIVATAVDARGYKQRSQINFSWPARPRPCSTTNDHVTRPTLPVIAAIACN